MFSIITVSVHRMISTFSHATAHFKLLVCLFLSLDASLCYISLSRIICFPLSLSLLCGIKWWINFEHPFSHPLKVVSTVAVMHLFKKKIQASTREVRFLTRGTEERETTPSTSVCRVWMPAASKGEISCEPVQTTLFSTFLLECLGTSPQHMAPKAADTED